MRSFQQIGQACGVLQPDIDSVKACLSSTERSWLLILDNADAPSVDYSTYFPSANSGSIIITTRNGDLASHYSTVGSKLLDQLPNSLAEELLLKAAGIKEERWNRARSFATDIVSELGRHTISLITAGAFIKVSCTLEKYLGLYKKRKDRLFKFSVVQEKPTYGDVFRTFEISAEHLRELPAKEPSRAQDARDALDLLSMLAFMHYEGPMELIFQTATSYASSLPMEGDSTTRQTSYFMQYHARFLPKYLPWNTAEDDEWECTLRWRRACNLLEMFSLISMDESDDAIALKIHPLVHTWTRERQDAQLRKQSWYNSALTLALSFRGARRYLQDYEFLHSHIQACLKDNCRDLWSQFEFKQIAPVLMQLVCFKFEIFDFTNVDDVFSQIISGYPHQVHGDDPLILEARRLKGFYLIYRGQNIKAIQELSDVVLTLESKLDEKDPSLLESQVALASAYSSYDRPHDATRLFKRVISILKQALEENDPYLLVTQQELAVAYIDDGRTWRAIDLLKHIKQVRSDEFQDDHPDVLATEHHLARAYLIQGHTGLATMILRNVINLKTRMYHEGHPSHLGSLQLFAEALIENGKLEEGIKIKRRVIDVASKSLHEGHPLLLARQTDLARVYLKNKKTNEAILLLEHVVKAGQVTPDDNQRNRLSRLRELEGAYYLAGRNEDAKGLRSAIEEASKDTTSSD